MENMTSFYDNSEMIGFWKGIESKYPLCCIIFFCDVWSVLKREHVMFSGRPECYDYFSFGDYIHCPKCAIKKLKEKK